MSEKTYNQATEAAFLTLLGALQQGEWGAVQAPAAPAAADVLSLGVLALCKVNLLRALTALRSVLHPRPEDAPALFDQSWDHVQRLWANTVEGLELSADPQARADGALLRAATLKGKGTAQTSMRYEAEVQWGFAQVQKADEPPIRAAIDRHNLQDHIDQIADTTSALADAIGWSTQAGKRLSPSDLRRNTMRRCAQTCSHTDQTLDMVLALLPASSPEATRVLHFLGTLRQCRS
jgi:hypothetical protein